MNIIIIDEIDTTGTKQSLRVQRQIAQAQSKEAEEETQEPNSNDTRVSNKVGVKSFREALTGSSMEGIEKGVESRPPRVPLPLRHEGETLS